MIIPDQILLSQRTEMENMKNKIAELESTNNRLTNITNNTTNNINSNNNITNNNLTIQLVAFGSQIKDLQPWKIHDFLEEKKTEHH